MILMGDYIKSHNPIFLDFVPNGSKENPQSIKVELKGIFHEGELNIIISSSVR